MVSLTKSDRVVTTSPQQVSSLFVEYYENLLGTRNNVLRLDSGVLADGARVEDEQALALTRPVLDEDIKVALFDIGVTRPLVQMVLHLVFSKKLGILLGLISVQLLRNSLDLVRSVDNLIMRLLLVFLKLRMPQRLRILDQLLSVMWFTK